MSRELQHALFGHASTLLDTCEPDQDELTQHVIDGHELPRISRRGRGYLMGADGLSVADERPHGHGIWCIE